MYLLDTLPDPAHHRHGHAVSQRLVARTIWAELGWFATPRNQRVVVGETLKALTLARGEAAHGGCKDVRLIAAPRRRAQATGKVVAKFCGCAAVAATNRNKLRDVALLLGSSFSGQCADYLPVTTHKANFISGVLNERYRQYRFRLRVIPLPGPCCHAP